MVRALVMVLAISFVVACTAKIKGPEAEFRVPGVEVEMEPIRRVFCPTGQAKKGRC